MADESSTQPVQGFAGTSTAEPVLELDGLTSGYNGSAVLRDLSLTVRPGEVVALLGANGAGKTTTLLTISGIVKPMGGRVSFNGADLKGSSPDARARLINALMLAEIARLPQKALGLPMPREPRLAKLCRAFVAAPDPHLTIEDWAGSLAMSRRAFTRAFRVATGLSLSVWRQQACLFTAVPRLADGEPVTTVALDLGYDSVAAFTTMFTRMLGASPRAYFARGRG